jgi:hypothetical protein
MSLSAEEGNGRSQGGGNEDRDIPGARLTEHDTSARIERKLRTVFRALRDVRWSLSQFLEACVREKDAHGRVINGDFGGPLSERRAKVAQAISNPFVHELDVPTVTTIRQELRALMHTDYYGQWDHTSVGERLNFPRAFQTIEAIAPVWNELLITLMSNQRTEWTSYHAQPDPTTMSQHIFTITSIVYASQAKKTLNFFQSLLDIYLIGSGVKRRVIETLSGFGICHSYKTANKRLKLIADSA